MELPAYHVPAWGNVLRATWERGWSFIKRAGTVILAATIILWFLQGFGFENGAFTMVEDQDNSILAAIATKIAWIFAPLGFGNWRATVASVSGLIAKENVVGTFGVLYHFGGELSENGDEIWAAVAQDYTALSAYAFMIFNLLCAPCFAAMGAIKREMNNGKWTAIAIGYMCALAYCAALVVYQIGGLIRAFKQVYGLPINTYLRRCRVQHAEQLLFTTDLSILEIAQRVGYDSPSRFAAMFKREKGITPRECRRVRTDQLPEEKNDCLMWNYSAAKRTATVG